jgi:hypothetical protein
MGFCIAIETRNISRAVDGSFTPDMPFLCFVIRYPIKLLCRSIERANSQKNVTNGEPALNRIGFLMDFRTKCLEVAMGPRIA